MTLHESYNSTWLSAYVHHSVIFTVSLQNSYCKSLNSRLIKQKSMLVITTKTF